jgi:hypothetical protein
MGAQMLDAANRGKDRAEGWVARATQPDNFTANPIFLGRKSQRNKGCGIEFGIGCRGEININTRRGKAQIAEAKGESVRRRGGVFARAEKKEKGQCDHVSNGLCAGSGDKGSSLHNPK